MRAFTRRKPNRTILELFRLEGRLVPATFNWTGMVNTDWTNGLNWTVTNGSVASPIPPRAEDDVVISLAEAWIEIPQGGSGVAKTVTSSPSTSVNIRGSLAVDGVSEFKGALALEGGLFTAQGLATLAGGLTCSGGQFNGYGGFKLAGGGNVSGLLNINSKVATGATLALTGSGSLSIFNTASVSVDSGAVLDIRNDQGINGAGTLTLGGKLLKSAGSGISVISVGGLAINGGTLEGKAGVLSLEGVTGTWAGAGIQTSAGAEIRLGKSASGTVSNIYPDGSLVFAGSGSFVVGSGARLGLANFNSAVASLDATDGQLRLEGGEIAGDGSRVVTNKGFIVSGAAGGTLYGVENNGTIRIGDGDTGSNRVTNTALGTITLAGKGALFGSVVANSLLVNLGTIRKTGSATAEIREFNGGGFQNSGKMEVAGGTLSLRNAGGTWTAAKVDVSAGSELRVTETSAGYDTILFLEGTQDWKGSGKIVVDAGGALVLDQNTTAVATLNAGAGLLQMDGGIARGQGARRITNAGSITIGDKGATLNTFDNQGTITIGGGDLALGAFTNRAGGVVDLAGAGWLVNQGNNDRMNNNGTLRHSGAGTSGVRGLYLDNAGILESTMGTLSVGSTTLNETQGVWTQGDFRASKGAVVDITGRYHITGSYIGSGSGAVTLRGTLSHDPNNPDNGPSPFAFGGGLFSLDGGSIEHPISNLGEMGSKGASSIRRLTNQGKLVATAGQLTVQQSTDYDSTNKRLTGGTWTVKDNATLQFSPGNIEQNSANVTLGGPNSSFPAFSYLKLNAGNLTLDLGKTLDLSPRGVSNTGAIVLGEASLLKTGNYTQGKDATLGIWVTGSAASGKHGRLQCSTATLDGVFMAQTAQGLTLVPGDRYPAVSYTSKSGNFSSYEGLTFNGTPRYSVADLDSAITLVAAPPALSITTNTLAAGKVGSTYSSTITSSGGLSPVTFSVTAGALPAGITLTAGTGALAGTPTVAGTYSFTVTATDAMPGTTATTASKVFSLFVDPAQVANAGVYAVAAMGGTATSKLVLYRLGTNELLGDLAPFPGFKGEFYVDHGDVSGDGIDDIIVGSGNGSKNGHVVVFDGARLSDSNAWAKRELAYSNGGSVRASLYAFVGYSSGVAVRLADVTNDGYDDLILAPGTGAGASTPAHLRVWDGKLAMGDFEAGKPLPYDYRWELASFWVFGDGKNPGGGMSISVLRQNGPDLVVASQLFKGGSKLLRYDGANAPVKGVLTTVTDLTAWPNLSATGNTVVAFEIGTNRYFAYSGTSKTAPDTVFVRKSRDNAAYTIDRVFAGTGGGLRLGLANIDNDPENELLITREIDSTTKVFDLGETGATLVATLKPGGVSGWV